MREADVLAFLRKPASDATIRARIDATIRARIDAMAVPLHATDPTCVILDTASNELMGYEDDQRAAMELSRDDLADWCLPRIDAELDARHHAEAHAVRSIGVTAW